MRARLRDIVFLVVALGGAGALAASLLRPLRRDPERPAGPILATPDLGPIVGQVDATFRRLWSEQGLVPAPPAPELAVMRRLSLVALGHGPIPGGDPPIRGPAGGRADRAWLDDLLRDRRCADYLAERFARAFVGTEDGPFLKFRRRRFVAWLSDAILENRRYDALVRDLIADIGVWTDHPAVNFLAVTYRREDGPARRPIGWRRGCRGRSWACGSTAPSATTTRSSPGSRRTSAAWPPSSAGRTPTSAASATSRTITGRPTARARSPSGRAARPVPRRAAAGLGEPARAARGMDHRPEEPEPRPCDGQPRLGAAVRPPAGRAGRRPVRRHRDPPGPEPSPTTSPPTAMTSIGSSA